MVRYSLLFAAICLATLSSALSSSSSTTASSKTPSKTPKPSPSSKCFYPNGKPEQHFAYDYQPCGGKNTTWNQCCIPGQDVCTPDGLCTHLTNAVGAYDYRGGCTNADWSGCPQVCLDVLSNSWLQVKQCASGEYCCNPDFDHGDCCRDGSRRFALLARNPDAKDDTPPPPKKTNGTDHSGGSDKGNTTQTDDGADKDNNSDESNASLKSNSVKIGAAVGGSLGGVALIGCVVGVWLVLRKKKMRRFEKDGTEVSSPGTVESLAMKQAYVPASETAYTPIAEVDGRPAVAEMDARGVHELGA
ncbi:hypothetical protein V8C42DRAFT_326233 [Trichoderma barbatum]